MTSDAPIAGYASVAVPVPVRRLFTYLVTTEQSRRLTLGAAVRVPFGRRSLTGTVVEWPSAAPAVSAEGAEIRLRPLGAVLHDRPVLPREILELTRFLADYYLCSWGEAIDAARPPEMGMLTSPPGVRRAPGAPSELGLSRRARAQQRLWERLPQDATAVPLAELDASMRRALPVLLRAGVIERVMIESGSGHEPTAEALEAGPPPTSGQRTVLATLSEAIDTGQFAPFLLFGATGSGKTEVYFRAAERVLASGRSVLYLVPEIGLTPLLLTRVARRFGGLAAALHSGLTDRQRNSTWGNASTGRTRLIVGTRSAVFAPLTRVGLIVVDEEQDGSYKQEDSPRYHARDLAAVRARDAGAVLLLGSATPSMESFQHAQRGRYTLLRLGGRVEERPLARVELVDMREEYRREGRITPLSRRLLSELESCLARREQALVLRNRRGWAVALYCPRCGSRASCAHCSVSLTWHEADQRLRCHLCGSQQRRPEACRTCGEAKQRLMGEGTEHIEALLRDHLPSARVARMDRDTTRGRGAQERLLARFDRGEIDVLVGTQMIAKGHDFPRVTLVGVLTADQSLGMPDFRAGERAFQLLTQVAGRAGRGELRGRVVIQAYDPEHPVLTLAARQDYEEFFAREIAYRRALHYPPVTGLVRLIVQDRDLTRAHRSATLLADALRREGGERLQIGGPSPAPLERIQGLWRQHVLARSAGRRRLIGAVERALAAVAGQVPARSIHVDVDPQSLQ